MSLQRTRWNATIYLFQWHHNRFLCHSHTCICYSFFLDNCCLCILLLNPPHIVVLERASQTSVLLMPLPVHFLYFLYCSSFPKHSVCFSHEFLEAKRKKYSAQSVHYNLSREQLWFINFIHALSCLSKYQLNTDILTCIYKIELLINPLTEKQLIFETFTSRIITRIKIIECIYVRLRLTSGL